MKVLIALVLSVSGAVYAQTPAPVTVKQTPSSEALVKTAQDMAVAQKSLDTMMAKARAGNDANQRPITLAIQKANEDLLTELKQDKRYRDQLAKIDGLQKQLQAINQRDNQQFSQDIVPIQVKIGSDKALIDGLVPIVRQENGMTETATFDPATQKWTVPPAADKPVETKK